MSLDERMRAGTRTAAGSQPIDRAAAWEQVQERSHRALTRRNVLLTAAAAAAVVASVVWGPGIVDSLSGPGPHPSDRLPPAVGRAIDLAVDARPVGSILAHSPRLPDGPSRRHPPATADAPSRLVIGVEN